MPLTFYTDFKQVLLLTYQLICLRICCLRRRGSRAAATFKMERFVIIASGFQPLTIMTRRAILDVAAALDPPLLTYQLICFFAHIH